MFYEGKIRHFFIFMCCTLFRYVLPVVWLPRSEHSPDSCYFCISIKKSTGFRYETRDQMSYANIATVIPAKLRSEQNPLAPCEIDLEDTGNTPPYHDSPPQLDSSPGFLSSPIASTSIEPSMFEPTASELGGTAPHLITPSDFNNLVRDINLSQRNAEIVASRLKQWNLVSSEFRVTSPRKRSLTHIFDECFDLNVIGLAYCNDVCRLFARIGMPYEAKNWRLFIDASVESLKAVLLHNGNEQPSVPVCYGRSIPENYENMKTILELIRYDIHKWKICCDLKVVALLTGIKKGFSKHQCFICVWEGRQTHLHYSGHKWPSRVTFQIGQNSIDHIPLVDGADVILPPLHIKLGLVRNFVRALDNNGEAFKYLKTIFPKLSQAKIDNGRFIIY